MMFIPNQKAFSRAFFLLISGTRGGPVRLDILKLLVRRNMNINQISGQIKLDYKTVEYHMHVLEKNGFVKKETRSRENIYSISTPLASNKKLLKEISDMGKSR